MRYFLTGQLFLWFGFFGAAFCSVYALENAEAPWQTIPWPAYLALMAVGWAGVLILRMGRSAQRKKVATSAIGLEAVIAKLQECSTRLDSTLAHPIDNLTCEEVLDITDSQLAPLMANFVDDREILLHRLGTRAYTSIMTEFASGERYLNRAWSAAADGYVDEVKISVQNASTFLRAAVHQANAALADSYSGRAF